MENVAKNGISEIRCPWSRPDYSTTPTDTAVSAQRLSPYPPGTDRPHPPPGRPWRSHDWAALCGRQGWGDDEEGGEEGGEDGAWIYNFAFGSVLGLRIGRSLVEKDDLEVCDLC